MCLTDMQEEACKHIRNFIHKELYRDHQIFSKASSTEKQHRLGFKKKVNKMMWKFTQRIYIKKINFFIVPKQYQSETLFRRDFMVLGQLSVYENK